MTGNNKNTQSFQPYIAEAVCAALLQHVPVEQIKTYFLGTFKKSYSNDIEKIDTDEYGDNTSFSLYLNRNSIYDLLPEGIFHQTLGSNRVKNVQDAVAEHKRYRKEEKDARKFFAPVEQMLFRYKIYTAVAETEALYDIQNGRVNQSFYKFWRLDHSLPEAEAKRMLRLLPYADFIKGNKDATAAALSYILDKQVKISLTSRPESLALNKPKTIDSMRLGMDTVLGMASNELLYYWSINIEDIAAAELQHYVTDGRMDQLLTRFIEIFVPADVDVEYEIMSDKKSYQEFSENILGYGSYL